MTDDLKTVEAELRTLRTILRRAESLSPASRSWLIARLTAGEGANGEAPAGEDATASAESFLRP